MKNVVNVPTAVSDHSRNDLGAPCITTSSFFTPRIIYTKEVMPGSKITYQIDSMTRALAMFRPAYADVETHIRGFFVPFRVLWKPWNHFFTNTPYGSLTLQFNPRVRISDLVVLYCNPAMSTEVTSGFDFVDMSTSKKYKFTATGRYFYNYFISLGYKLNSEEIGSLSNDEGKSALPMMALFKVFFDYFSNPQDSVMYKQLESILLSWAEPTVSYLAPADILNAILCCQSIMYDVDYFTGSMENATAVNTGQTNTFTSYNDPQQTFTGTAGASAYYTQQSGPLIHNTGGTNLVRFTQAVDTMLHRIADTYRRLQVVGMRPLDRYFSQWGIKLNNERLNRSHYLGHYNSVFQISDIMSTAGTAQEFLGNYAGKAINYNLSGEFKLNSEEEFGQVIFICTIVPKVRYYQGSPRELNHVYYSHYFHPEYDKTGVQAIRADELLADNPLGNNIYTSSYGRTATIGFTSRYGEYKCQPTAILSGDFILPTRESGTDQWHLLRKIPARTFLDDTFKRTADRSQYERIFNFGSQVADPFISIFNIKADAILPCSALFDDYEWSDQIGRAVDIQKGGTFMN